MMTESIDINIALSTVLLNVSSVYKEDYISEQEKWLFYGLIAAY